MDNYYQSSSIFDPRKKVTARALYTQPFDPSFQVQWVQLLGDSIVYAGIDRTSRNMVIRQDYLGCKQYRREIGQHSLIEPNLGVAFNMDTAKYIDADHLAIVIIHPRSHALIVNPQPCLYY